MNKLFMGMFGMGFVLTNRINRHLREAVRVSAGRKLPANNMANRAAALGMMKAWAAFAAAKKDVAFYSRMGM